MALLWDLTQRRAMLVSSYLTNVYISKMHRLNRHGEARPVAHMRDIQLFRARDVDVCRSEVDKHNLLSVRCHSGIRLFAHCPTADDHNFWLYGVYLVFSAASLARILERAALLWSLSPLHTAWERTEWC